MEKEDMKMKAAYEKPQLDVIDYSLNAVIAACSIYSQVENSCNDTFKPVFDRYPDQKPFDDPSKCDLVVEGYCYYTPGDVTASS